jgi:hypothetical protein
MITVAARLVRLIVGMTFLCTLVAALVGRYAPSRRDDSCVNRRTSAHPRYFAVATAFRSGSPYVPLVLDTATGALSDCHIDDAEGLDLLGCSPWRDGRGQYHVVARHDGGAANRPWRFADSTELVRYTFPAGEVVERTTIEPFAKAPVCWAPDRSDRIIFASGNGQLYCYDFAAGTSARHECGAWQPRPLRCEDEQLRDLKPWIGDPCWPSEACLGGHIVVSLVSRGLDDVSADRLIPRLWWIRPDRAVEKIVAGSRAIIPDRPSVEGDLEERLPAVGRRHDGTLLLAYLSRPFGCSGWDLCVAPIAVSASNDAPRTLASARRRVARGCAAIKPTFSPDGRWVFAAEYDGHARIIVKRYPIDMAATAPARRLRPPGGKSQACGGRREAPE